MEKRIYSYQDGAFGIDFGLSKKNFLQIRYGGANANTEDGFTVLPCTQLVINKHERKQREKQEARESRQQASLSPPAYFDL